MNENTSEMIYEPQEENPKVIDFFALLQDPRFDQEVLEQINNQIQEGGIQAAAQFLFERFGLNLKQMSNLPQLEQAQ